MDEHRDRRADPRVAPPAGGAATLEEALSRREQRAEAQRRAARRGQAIATVSTVVVLGGLIVLTMTSPGWDAVRTTFFSSSKFVEVFPDVLGGFWIDVKMFVLVEIAVLALGLLVALVRVTSSPALFPLRIIGTVFTDLFRGIPVILLVYLIGFGIPALQLTGLPTDKLLLGGFALTLSYSAYVSEVFRAGIRSVPAGQRDAALAVGLTEAQTARHVILPQALRRVGPPLLNDFIALQKDVALISVLGPQEAYRIAQIEAASDFNYTPLLAAALLYLLVTVPLARLLDRWSAKRGEIHA